MCVNKLQEITKEYNKSIDILIKIKPADIKPNIYIYTYICILIYNIYIIRQTYIYMYN